MTTFDNSVKGAGMDAGQAPPAAAHIDEGSLARIEDTEGAAPADFGAQAAAAAAAGRIIDQQFEGHVPNGGHQQAFLC